MRRVITTDIARRGERNVGSRGTTNVSRRVLASELEAKLSVD
jgi:hypothetical protein